MSALWPASDSYLLYREHSVKKKKEKNREGGKKNIKLLILLCAHNHLSLLAWR